MRSQHDNTPHEKGHGSKPDRKGETETRQRISGCLPRPQTWSPTFRLTFPRLQLGIVLGLRLLGTSGHTKLWMKRVLKSTISTWTLYDFFSILMVLILIFRALFFFFFYLFISSCSSNFSFWKSEQVRIFQYMFCSVLHYFSLLSPFLCATGFVASSYSAVK